MRYLIPALLMLLSCLAGSATAASHSGSPLSLLGSDQHFAMLRHALAPGTGDPAGFIVEDCATQRNLDDAGRRQAASIGTMLREMHGNEIAVYSSRWCRCLDTARLMDVGPVVELPSLNSFYEARENQTAQTEALTDWLASADLDRPLILVTHQVNITALVGEFARSGELVIVERRTDGSFSVVGKVTTALDDSG